MLSDFQGYDAPRASIADCFRFRYLRAAAMPPIHFDYRFRPPAPIRRMRHTAMISRGKARAS